MGRKKWCSWGAALTCYRTPWSVWLHVTYRSCATKQWWQLTIPSSPAPTHLLLFTSNFLSVTPSSAVPRFRSNSASLIPHPSTRHTSSTFSACNAPFFWMKRPLFSSLRKMTASLRPRRENVSAQHLPYPQITLTFHAHGGHSHVIQHAQVQGCPRQTKMDRCIGPGSGSRAEISLHQSQTISPNWCPGGCQSGNCW